MLLTIDCGNTKIRALRHPDGAGVSTATAAPQLEQLSALWQPGMRVVMTSVVAAAAHAVRAAFAARGVRVEQVGQDLPCPLRLDYATIETLGADRWLGAFAAHRRFAAAITVDCGSATTVNLVTADGVFRGGAIGPGLEALAMGLAQKAPALPIADLAAEPVVPAATSQASVDAGVWFGYLGLVERLIREVAAAAVHAPSPAAEAASLVSPPETPAGIDAQQPGRSSPASIRASGPTPTIVLTGGNAARVHGRVPFECVHLPDLLHEGMVILAGSRP